jgi:two-component system, cell cycle response regulator DivK
LKNCVLVVEDQQLNRELLCDWLEGEGYEVWAAVDLKAAYDIFAKQVPHAVLLDINLGGENGLDLVKWMWQKSEFAEIPVIAVTAHAMVTDQDRIMRAGCRACLSKPVEFRVLREELKRWLQHVKTPQLDS